MQWDDSPFGGFSRVRPWLRLPDNYARVNVKVEQLDAFSMINFYKRLIELRQREPALHVGDYRSIHCDRQLIAYLREYGKDRFLIVLNLTHRTSIFQPAHFEFSGTIEVSTEAERNGVIVSHAMTLSGDEGVIIRLKS
jgi:alpha-glucosidase